MPENWMNLLLANFDLVMFVVALIFIFFHKTIKRDLGEAEIVYRWIALFALGFTLVYTFVFQVFFSETTAHNIGWLSSPFQYEVGMADLAFGVIAILSFNASYGFRLATVIGNTLFLWGCAINHIMQIIQYHNYAPGNAGTWLWMDILVPLILIICIIRLKSARTKTF